MEIKLCSGIGQYHSNESDPTAPEKTLTPYLTIDYADIQSMVDNPTATHKSESQWLIPSTLLSRNFSAQLEEGEFHLLWADFDENPKHLDQLEVALNSIINTDYDIYTTSSATQQNQKARILIPLTKPIDGSTFVICQAILNDKLAALGITPDTVNQRPAQLCYLPNRGEFYDKRSKRNGKLFNVQCFSSEIEQIKLAIDLEEERSKARKEAAALKKAALTFTGDKTSDLIGAFNESYTVEDILIQAGYKQRGNKFCHPESTSGSFGANVKNGRVHSLNENDPLYSNGKGAHDAFSAFTILFHSNDRKAALIDAGNTWLSINNESWNTVKQREYSKTMVYQPSVLETFHDIPGVNFDLHTKELLKFWLWSESYLKKALSMEHIPYDVYRPNILIKAWGECFYSGSKTKIVMFNKQGRLILSIKTEFLSYIKEVHGKFLFDVDKEIEKVIFSGFITKIQTLRQFEQVNIETNMFIEQPVMTPGNDSILIEHIHRPFKVNTPEHEVLAVVSDLTQHFPCFPDLIKLIACARFASNRREAYVWLHGVSGWGKTLLIDGVLGSELGLVCEVSIDEVTKIMDGTPVGKQASDFLKAWVLFVDEAKVIKGDVKKLDSKISLSPKYQHEFTTNLYTKIFASAETMDSFAGELGIEKQFANRFSYMDSKEAGRIDDRELFQRVGAECYRRALAAYVANYLNTFVKTIQTMGKSKAANHCSRELGLLHAKYNIELAHGSLEDAVAEQTANIRIIAIDFALGKCMGLMNTNRRLYDLLNEHLIIGTNHAHGRVVKISSSVKFIKSYLDINVDKSEVAKIKFKASIMVSMINEVGNYKERMRIKTRNGEISLKGSTIKIALEKEICFL